MIFQFFPIPRTPSSMMTPRTPAQWWSPGVALPHHWSGGAGFGSVLKKSCILLSTIDTSIGQKSHDIFHFFTLHRKIENLKFWKWIFWISNGRNYRDPEAPLAVVLRGDTTTRGATSEMLITCMSKTLVNAMFFGVKRLPRKWWIFDSQQSTEIFNYNKI